MELNTEKFKDLMNEKAEGNYNKFASMLKINVAHVYRIINSHQSAGKKTLSAVISFCKENGLNFEDYIFLE